MSGVVNGETLNYTLSRAVGEDVDEYAITVTLGENPNYDVTAENGTLTIRDKCADGHDLIDHAAQAPTCTAIGWDDYQTCSRCDYTTYVEKPALGHAEVTDSAVNLT